ncbi:hypothetical protein [Filimonas effusa]|uniref:Uncharacterized protein n=1 Tax=Filimonas effusa TaxID=2508721 RepID=A0A4Q1D5R7_9BACT|nr:hypothetical protein [Filimonas effusa]RXK83316.1 hypothetical protein ESB13_14515 [Filimonas effusa]
MSFLSQARHDKFLDAAWTTITRLENEGCDTQTEEFKQTLMLLQNIFRQCDDLTAQLRTLIKQYEYVQTNTRLKLRASRSKHLKL